MAIAEAALPKGQVLPAASLATVARAERVMGELPPTVRQGYRALLGAVEAWALATRRHRFARLPVAARLEVLESWQRADVARRLGLRALMAPLKVAHFDSPELYRTIGCVYEFSQVQGETKPRYMRERVHAPAEIQEDLELDCDAVVIGSGAGGAVVAKELAEQGHAVILLEEGHYFERKDFDGRAVAAHRKMYRDGGLTFSVGNVWIPIPMGRTVGGSTTVNSGTCYRVPGRVLRRWRDQMGLREFTENAMDGYYRRVESILGVAEARAEYLGGVARVIARGCDRLGYAHNPLRRNAPDCDGKGTCCFGCPTDAKRSTNVSYVPMALKAGAELFHGARVTRIVTSGTRATGVVAELDGGNGRPRTLTVHARVVVVSCGALMTPVLLQQNNLCTGSGQLGSNLSIHPAAAGIGMFDERIAGYNAIPQGYAINEFHDEGILFEGATAPLEIIMAASPMLGPPLVDLAESFDRAALFGFMVEDSSRGRVRVIGGRPILTYFLNDADVARIKRGFEILIRVFLAAGAQRIHPQVHGFDDIRSEADLVRFQQAKLRARDFELTAYHPLGTARMGLDAGSAVVGPDHESHEVQNLYIVDGAAVPSSLAVNPQVTIMAMATRAAERIDERLSRSSS